MAKDLSVFGLNTEDYQKFADTMQGKYRSNWFEKYFPFAAPQMSLNFVSALGADAVAAMASVVQRDAETPLRAQEALRQLAGEIPAIKVMRKLNESNYREYLALQNTNVNAGTKQQQVLDLIWRDMKYVVESVKNRLEYMVLQGISTGTMTLTVLNNPDGVVLSAPLNLQMPTGNKINASVAWSDANAKPITDIRSVVNTAMASGVTFGKVLIDAELYAQILNNTEVKETIAGYIGGNKSSVVVTNDKLDSFMVAAGLPAFEVINVRLKLEKNGTATTVNPFEKNNVVFIPEGNLGEIKNAIAIEDLNPVPSVMYAKVDQTLVSKWSENEPFGEWTKAELNALPVVTAIDQIYLLSSTKSF